MSSTDRVSADQITVHRHKFREGDLQFSPESSAGRWDVCVGGRWMVLTNSRTIAKRNGQPTTAHLTGGWWFRAAPASYGVSYSPGHLKRQEHYRETCEWMERAGLRHKHFRTRAEALAVLRDALSRFPLAI